MAGAGLCAQAPADAQKPATPQTGSNPFPEDTSNVPVVAPKSTADLPDISHNGAESEHLSLPGDDTDPVRSPDDPAPAATSADETSSSSSLAGMDRLLPKPGDDEPDRKEGRKKLTVKEPTHQEAASEDINVGGYYLDKKNWKAALSRFQSAMVLDPENPEAFWGLAEAERHLGDFADARTHYKTVVDYDPESKHGKEAAKALKTPEIANAKAAAAASSSVDPQK
jgi:tetratricopeptide (TPR) repeat protein